MQSQNLRTKRFLFMENQEEIWKDIPGFEGRYQCSNFGRIKSLPRSRRCRNGYSEYIGCIVKQQNGNAGYSRVALRGCDSRTKMFSTHRLVAILFIDNPLNAPEVNHIDGNKENNHYSNLEWCTSSENKRHAFKIGLRTQSGENNNSSKLTEADVLEIRARYKPRIVTLKMLANEYGMSKDGIEFIVNRRTWKHI